MLIALGSGNKTVLYKIIHRQRWFHRVMASENMDLSCFENSQVRPHTDGQTWLSSAACPEHQGFHTQMKKIDTECGCEVG